MLRKRNRLVTVGVVVLGTIVSTQPQSYAQQLGLQLNSNSSPPAQRVGTRGNTPHITRPAPAKRLDPNKAYSPAQMNIGESESNPAPIASPARPSSSLLVHESSTQDLSQDSEEGLYLRAKPIDAPESAGSKTSRSILLEFGEDDTDRAPFGLMTRGEAGRSPAVSSTPTSTVVGSRKTESPQTPTISIPAPPLPSSTTIAAGRPFLQLGDPVGGEPALSEPELPAAELGEIELGETARDDFEFTQEFIETEKLDDEPFLLEMSNGLAHEASVTRELHPGMTETMKDVFVNSDESDIDLLDVDPGLPEVDPSLVEDVSIAEEEDDSEETEEVGQYEGSAQLLKQSVAPIVNERTGRPIRTPLSIRELGGTETSGLAPIVSSQTAISPAHSIDDEAPNGQDDLSDTASRSRIELQKELHQEAPIIDVRQSQSRREDQGVDALLATKPVSMKREISNGEVIDESIELPPIVSATQLPALNAAESQRLLRTNACLSHYLSHPESTSVRSPWAVMHALLAFGPDYELQHGDSRVNAIGWMCHNGTCRTQRMFTPKGQSFVPNVGAGVQGHEGQFLAVLAQSNVPLDYPIQIGTNKFKVEDLVRYEMATCRENSELTFKLIGLSYYLDSEKQWKANDGKVWSIQKLIQQELAQPVVGAACGGTHRLMGFSFAVRQRAMQGQSITGQFARANQFVKSYIDYTWKLQNPDGSFSTSWYEGRGNEPNNERKVQTTGHMLEWLMYTLPDAEVNQPRVQKSIDFILSHIYDNKEHKWPIGPRGHATRAVALYQARYQELLRSAPELLETNTSIAESRSDNNLAIPMIEGSGTPRFTSTKANANNNANQSPNASRATNAPSRSTRVNLLQPPRLRGNQRR